MEYVALEYYTDIIRLQEPNPLQNFRQNSGSDSV